MTEQELPKQTQRPANRKDLAICYKSFTDTEIHNDPLIKELHTVCTESKFYTRWTYAVYADANLVSENMFTPCFHTSALNSSKKFVILRGPLYELINIYSWHEYIIYGDNEEDLAMLKQIKEAFPDVSVKHIETLKDL